MTTPRGHAAGVHRALTTAGFFFAGIAPAVQFAAFHSSTPPYPNPALIWVAFAIHGAVWLAAVCGRLPAATMLASWSVVGISIGAQMAAAGVAEPVATRNIALTIAAATAMLLPLRQALAASAAVSLTTATAVLVAAQSPTSALWSIAVQTPIYSVSVAAALALAFRELRRVAEQADDQARAQLEADRTVQRKERALEAARRRARTIHDTIVNTLGAIATGRIVSSDPLVARRCAEDARMADLLRRSAAPQCPSVDDVITHAAAVGVRLQTADLATLSRRLGAEQSWRRREVISILREAVTNIGKHAGATQARLSYDAQSSTVTVRDDGAGMADPAPLTEAMADRVRDARAQVQIRSEAGHGTTVALQIPPLDDTATGVFEAASARMATAVAAVMLTEFLVIAVVITAFSGDWSSAAVLPQVLMWSVTAAVLAILVRSAGRERTLPVHAVIAAYLGLLGMVVVYHLADATGSVCGLKPTLAWGGDAVATVGAILVLVDGRFRVVGPAVGMTAAAIVAMLIGTESDCLGSTLGLFATDLLVIGAFYLLRRQTLRLSTVAAEHHGDQIRRREEQERIAAEDALHDDGFAATLEFSKDILQAVADRPERARHPQTRAEAGLEESYLRALIGLTADIATATALQHFVGAIDAARSAGVRISVHAAPGVLNDEYAGIVVSTLRQIIAKCEAGDDVSLGVFGPESAPSLIIVAPPPAVERYADATAAAMPPGTAQFTVTPGLGLIEMRWFDVAHRSGG